MNADEYLMFSTNKNLYNRHHDGYFYVLAMPQENRRTCTNEFLLRATMSLLWGEVQF